MGNRCHRRTAVLCPQSVTVLLLIFLPIPSCGIPLEETTKDALNANEPNQSSSVWLWQKPIDANQADSAVEWVAFYREDQEILEAAFVAGVESCVALADGKWDGCVKDRLCRAKFWPDEGLKIMRALWFRRRWTPILEFDPLPENVSDSIEVWMQHGATTPLTVSIQAEEDYTISIKQTAEDAEVVAQYNGFVGPIIGATQLKRGRIPHVFDPEPMPTGTNVPARHLILAVHGIGEAFFASVGGVQTWVEQVSEFAKLCARVDPKAAGADSVEEADDQTPQEGSKVEILPIQWHKVVHDRNSGLRKRLQKITLKTAPRLRDMANYLAGDVLYYSTGRYRQKILEAVAMQMNEAVRQWRAAHQVPEHAHLPVSLLGHSLGSVIAYDLAMAQEGRLDEVQGDFQLDFAFENLFLLGSPVGFFVTSRDTMDWQECAAAEHHSPVLPRTVRTYNLMQASDPIAYRIEPLMLPDIIPDDDSEGSSGSENGPTSTATRINAAYVPYSNTDGVAPHVAARVAVDAMSTAPKALFGGEKGLREAKETLQAAVETVAGVALNPQLQEHREQLTQRLRQLSPSGERVDWVLQEGASRTMLSEYINAIESHMRYFDQDDLARFIVARCDLGPP